MRTIQSALCVAIDLQLDVLDAIGHRQQELMNNIKVNAET